MAQGKRGILGWMAWPITGPAVSAFKTAKACLGLDMIKASHRDIRTLWSVVREKPPEPPPVLVDLDGALRRRLWNTAYATWVYVASAAVVTAYWAWSAYGAPAGLALVVSALVTTIVVAMLCLMAFLKALQHWKARRGGVGTAAEFLRTTDPWWPRLPPS